MESENLTKSTFTEMSSILTHQMDTMKSFIWGMDAEVKQSTKDHLNTSTYLGVHLPRITQSAIDKALMDVLGDRKKHAQKLKQRMAKM